MNSSRRCYDTKVKYLARVDLLPPSFTNQINRSLLWKWKQETNDKYFGGELTIDLDKHYDILKKFSEHKKAQKVFLAYLRLAVTFQKLVSSSDAFYKILHEQKELVVDSIQRVSKTLPLEKAVRIFNISTRTYYNWLLTSKTNCFESFFQACNRVYSSQLTRPEINKMKDLLTDSRFLHWPVTSLAHYASRNNILHLHLKTWYKYVPLLNIKRKIPLHRRKKNHVSIRASKPNEKWHADVTVFTTLNNTKYYIYLVMDNFSRYILSWKISDKLCAKTRLETFQEAYQLSSSIYPDSETELIVDGGSENNNLLVNDYIENKIPSIRKTVALKNVYFSNSMAEALNKILKYQYLYRQPIYDFRSLETTFQNGVEDYNFQRPHIGIGGLTPYESFTGVKINNSYYRNQRILARENRIAFNKRNICKSCVKN
jgi:putative transposase